MPVKIRILPITDRFEDTLGPARPSIDRGRIFHSVPVERYIHASRTVRNILRKSSREIVSLVFSVSGKNGASSWLFKTGSSFPTEVRCHALNPRRLRLRILLRPSPSHPPPVNIECSNKLSARRCCYRRRRRRRRRCPGAARAANANVAAAPTVSYHWTV